MQLLILGGTVFLGSALAADAVARGWQVTTFSRGRSGEPSPGAQALHGDRTVNGDLDHYMRYYKNRYREERHLARYDPGCIEDLGLTA